MGKAANENRFFVPTGFQSQNLILDAAFPELDVTVDVDSDLNLIKGGGACHLREKVIAESAKTFVVVADFRKESKVLGEKYTKGVPVEIVPFASARVLSALRALGSTKAALRMAKEKAGPVVTDNGNFCVDAPFPESMMRDPSALLHQIKFITGVVEVGLFTNMCEAAYFGNEDGTITIQSLDGSKEANIKVDL
ncbi:Rki1p [Malassezia vespertilionis]|uniref:Ribose-5-phosphate isomerase n=1 Tax=Malassezia vespertilionis TaxID=2020962 RepID=A0A2N1J847_9BASI|nr:Rki1p [Malassezia vespertilionis]